MCPIDPTIEVVSGGTISLEVYAAGDPPLSSTDIRWFNPRGELIMGDSRVLFRDSNKRLLVQNASLADSGTYRIDIYRGEVLAETTVELNVHGEYRLVVICSSSSSSNRRLCSRQHRCRYSINQTATRVGLF